MIEIFDNISDIGTCIVKKRLPGRVLPFYLPQHLPNRFDLCFIQQKRTFLCCEHMCYREDIPCIVVRGGWCIKGVAGEYTPDGEYHKIEPKNPLPIHQDK
jgi:hypothetical protein